MTIRIIPKPQSTEHPNPSDVCLSKIHSTLTAKKADAGIMQEERYIGGKYYPKVIRICGDELILCAIKYELIQSVSFSIEAIYTGESVLYKNWPVDPPEPSLAKKMFKSLLNMFTRSINSTE